MSLSLIGRRELLRVFNFLPSARRTPQATKTNAADSPDDSAFWDVTYSVENRGMTDWKERIDKRVGAGEKNTNNTFHQERTPFTFSFDDQANPGCDLATGVARPSRKSARNTGSVSGVATSGHRRGNEGCHETQKEEKNTVRE